MNIFVLEDDADVLDVIKHYLEDIDAIKHFFLDSHEALEVAAREKVDLLITDIFMPKMNGLEIISAFQEKHPDCKIIAMSAGGDSGGFVKSLVLDEALTQGASCAIQKPFLQEDLINEIERLFTL
ncbi:MAG: CheY-like chemotaxis protein [Bacteriovoracaceae bacterium]|jgi:CheY-like chemotaxis protein